MNGTVIIIAILGFSGQILATVIGSYLSRRSAKQAQRDAVEAQVATVRAAGDAYKAQKSAIEAAKLLVESAQNADRQLGEIRGIADSTHKIVNNQRTVMLRLVATLSRRIANDNPGDAEAQLGALAAEDDARKAP